MTARSLVIAGLLILRSAEGIAQNTTANEREIIQKTLADVSTRLTKTNCGAFFGPESLETLKSAQIQVAVVQPPMSKPGPAGGRFERMGLVVAVTYRAFNLVIINRLGPFMAPRKLIGGRRYNLGLGDEDFRVLVLLHELGHLMGKFQAEGTHETTNEEHSDAVLRHCFGA